MKTKLFPLMNLLLIVGCTGLTGCAGGIKNSMRLSEKDSTWNPLSILTAEKKREATDEEQTPVTMAAIWKDSAYEKVGEKTVIGFGGRIFFYDRDNNAVKADGELIVYGFDDSEQDGETKVGTGADKKFVFRQSEFQTHFSESGLGASYSVWVPWEKIGGYRKSVTLIPVFKTADGKILESGQSIVVLPGKTFNPNFAEKNPDQPYKVLGHSSAVVSHANFHPKSNGNQASQNDGVSQVSFDQRAEGQRKFIPNKSGIRSSTINVNKSLARRMAAASATDRLKTIRAKREAEVARMNADQSEWIEHAKQQLGTSSLGSNATGQEASTDAPAQVPTANSQRAFGAPGSF